MEHDTVKAVNMKLILCIFEQLSGLKINFHKSEIFFWKAKDDDINIDRFWGVSLGRCHSNYSVSLSNTELLGMQSGILLKVLLPQNLLASGVKCFLMGIAWFLLTWF